MAEPGNPRSLVLQSRVDVKDAATLARWCVEHGIQPRSKSELITTAVTVAIKYLSDFDKLEPIETVDEAVRILENCGLGIQSRGKPRRELLKVLSQEGEE